MRRWVLSKEWINVYTIFDEIEASQLEAILKENNIPVDVFYYQATSVYSVFQPSIGKGVIRVSEEHIEKTRKIIADFNSQSSDDITEIL